MTAQRRWAYIDTSLLALRYVEDTDGPRARRLIREYRLVTSALTLLELDSVLHQRVASGTMSKADRDAAGRRLGDDQGFWAEMPIGSEVLSRSRDVIRRTGVRTLDAIHLATALLRREAGRGPLPFLTRDAHQAHGARALGFEVLGLPERSRPLGLRA